MVIAKSIEEASAVLDELDDGYRIVKHPYKNRLYAVVESTMADSVAIYYMDGGQ